MILWVATKHNDELEKKRRGRTNKCFIFRRRRITLPIFLAWRERWENHVVVSRTKFKCFLFMYKYIYTYYDASHACRPQIQIDSINVGLASHIRKKMMVGTRWWKNKKWHVMWQGLRKNLHLRCIQNDNDNGGGADTIPLSTCHPIAPMCTYGRTNRCVWWRSFKTCVFSRSRIRREVRSKRCRRQHMILAQGHGPHWHQYVSVTQISWHFLTYILVLHNGTKRYLYSGWKHLASAGSTLTVQKKICIFLNKKKSRCMPKTECHLRWNRNRCLPISLDKAYAAHIFVLDRNNVSNSFIFFEIRTLVLCFMSLPFSQPHKKTEINTFSLKLKC